LTRKFILITCCIALLVLLGCAAGPNMSENIPDYDGGVAGFWRGLWHGLISPVTFIISFFSDSVHFYEIHNNGNWYNLGFLLGLLILFGGSLGKKCRK
jgi:hypothetical protein